MSNTYLLLHRWKIEAMLEGMRRVKRRPERGLLEDVIDALAQLQPGERLIIERMLPDERNHERWQMSDEERAVIEALERTRHCRLTREEEQQALQQARLRESGGALWQWN